MNSSPLAVGLARRHPVGFTLIELLVTMVVGTLLIVFLFQIFNATVSAWRRGESQNDTYREARAAMQIMVRDLSQTTAPILATPAPTAASTPSGSPTPTPGIAPVLVLDRYNNYLAQDPPPQGGDEINEEAYCLTNVPNNGVSSLCAVGFFCAWMPDLVAEDDPQATQKRSRAPRAYALVRQFLGSGRPGEVSGTTTIGAVAGLFDLIQTAKGRPLSFADVYKRVRPGVAGPGQSVALAGTTQLATYIWDLQFRTVKTLQNNGTQTSYTGNYPFRPDLPAYVEIRFKALSEAAARQLEANGGVERLTWKNPSSNIYSKFILPGTRQFVARAPIYGGAAVVAP